MNWKRIRSDAAMYAGSLIELIIIPSICIFYFMYGSRNWKIVAVCIGITWLLMWQGAVRKESINDMLNKALTIAKK